MIPLASVLVTLSLTPAILGGIGPRVDWPKIRHENTASRFWTAWARGVVRHRVLAATGALLVLGALFLAFLDIKIGAASSESLAHSGPAYDTLQVLEDGGITDGVLTPLEVLVSKDQAQQAADDRWARSTGSSTPSSAPTPSSGSGDQTVVVLVPQYETVNSQSVGVVRDVTAAAEDVPGVVGVTGLGNAQVDFLHAVYGNFPLMLAIIAVLTFVLLARAFRSVLLPVKAVLLNLASLAAVFGSMVLFWQMGHGSEQLFGIAATGAVTFWVPMMIFAFLYGLSMDYEVFILSRIREEYDAGLSTDDAVDRGHRPHRPAGHQRRADPVPRLRGPGVRAQHRPEDHGHRPRLRHPAGRDHRALAAGAVAGVPVRALELVAPRRHGTSPARRAVPPARRALPPRPDPDPEPEPERV